MKKIITALALFVAVSTSTITSFARSAPCPSCGKMTANSVTTVEYAWEWETCTHGYYGHQDNVYYKLTYKTNKCSNCGNVLSCYLISKVELKRYHDQIED